MNDAGRASLGVSGTRKPTERVDPCQPNPCGPNSSPSVSGTRCVCTCDPEYFGDPYSGCRPECTYNEDCPYEKACVRNKCVDPCIGVCGENAECRVVNHNPICSCIQNYIGDPFVRCNPRKSIRFNLKHGGLGLKTFIFRPFQVILAGWRKSNK